jgi:glutathione S-transferase
VLTLYQAEWCPFSCVVRQRLTELGIDFVAKQVEPRQDDRDGQHEIPLLTNDDGERFEGTDACFEFLESLAPRGSGVRAPRAVPRSSARPGAGDGGARACGAGAAQSDHVAGLARRLVTTGTNDESPDPFVPRLALAAASPIAVRRIVRDFRAR